MCPAQMHMDHFYFPHEQDTMTAYTIYIDDATVDNGCLCVYPGSHLLPVPEHAPDGKYLPPSSHPLEAATPVPAPAGSVLMFNYRTIHGSYPNKSDQIRRMILYQVRAPDDRPIVRTHESPGQGMMLRGQREEKEGAGVAADAPTFTGPRPPAVAAKL
jgi:phytanoyl-CoA hydroxylase